MSEQARRTRIVFEAVEALHEAGVTSFRPGDLADRLRAGHTPFGAWEVRGELANLERLGLIMHDEDTATWQLVEGQTFSVQAANAICR